LLPDAGGPRRRGPPRHGIIGILANPALGVTFSDFETVGQEAKIVAVSLTQTELSCFPCIF
jgi:hypothetical protein